LFLSCIVALVLTTCILASTLVAPQPVQAASSGSWENLGVFHYGGNGVWGAAANDIWTVGNSGTIMHFDGVYWNTVDSHTAGNLNGIWGTAADNIYACGGGGTILHYDGITWSVLPSTYRSNYVSISGTGPDNIWVVGFCGAGDEVNRRGVIVHYDGTTWTRDYPDYNGWFEFTAVSCVTETFVAAIGQIKDLAIFRWTGTEWVPTKTPYVEFSEGWGVSDIYGNYAAAGRGRVLKWDGTKWVQISDGLHWVGGGIWASSDSDVFVSGSEGPMWHWDGSSWQQQQVSTGYWFNDFWGTGPNNVFAVGAGACARYDGNRWREFGIKAGLLDIYGTSLNNIWVCGDGEYVGHFDGTGWYVSHPVPFPWGSKHHLHGIWASGNNAFAVGHATYQDEPRDILHYNGTSWSTMSHPGGPLYGVWGTSPTNVFAVGDYWGFMGATYNNIIRYDGSSWTPMVSNAQNQFRDVWGSGPTDVWAVGANGLIAHYNGTGNSWSITPSSTGYWFEGIWGSEPNDIFIVGEAGVIYHFDGLAWSPMTSPTSTRLVGIWGSSPSNVFATGDNGVILHYDGNTWSMMSQTYTTGCLVDVWGASGSQPVFYAVGDNGCILRNTTSSGDPPAVTTDGYASLGPTTVTLNGNLTDKGSASTVNVRFEYGTTAGGPYPGSTADQPKTNTGTFSANVINLTPNTTYYYRAVAVGDGTVYGIERSFTTTTTIQLPRLVFTTYRDGNEEIYWMYINGASQTRLTTNPAKDTGPALSPDGTKIAFTSWRDGNADIYVMNADGTGMPTQLTTDPASDMWPAWSPDSSKIAFSSSRDGNAEIYVMNADGSDQKRLTNSPLNDVMPAWSPDGTRIAFVTLNYGNSEIYVLNVDGSGVTRLTNNPAEDVWPSWSPDGSKIAFVSSRDGNAEIYLMNADGSNQVNITNNSASDSQPSWITLPSNVFKIAFTTNRDGNLEVYTVLANGLGLYRLTNNTSSDWTRSYWVAPQVTTSDVTNITSHSATLNGNLDSLGSAPSAGNLINVSFVWGTAPGSYPNQTTPQPLNAAGAFSFSLPNLDEGTTYYFRAQAVGHGIDWGAEKNFTTPVLPSVTTNSATNILSNAATLNGTLTKLGTATTVNVLFHWGTVSGQVPLPNPTTPQSMTAPGAFSFNLPGLTPGTTYYFRFIAVDGPNIYTIGTEKSFTTLVNHPPILGTLTLPIDPVDITTVVNGSATFTDPDSVDTHTGIWDWGDSTNSAATINEANGNGAARGSHNYTEAGVYEVKLTLTDSAGASVQSVFQYVVVYDPSGGFVTGGGWINSPAGAYAVDPTLTGKATFGFVAKYQKGANVPTGQTEFQFHVGNLNFHSESYEWLVVAGAKAQYKGIGTINGAGTYRFMLTAIDGDLLASGKGADKFRIRIWDDNGLIYDNQMGKDENGDFATEIQGGSIVIHK
jgi:hypothetical protein